MFVVVCGSLGFLDAIDLVWVLEGCFLLFVHCCLAYCCCRCCCCLVFAGCCLLSAVRCLLFVGCGLWVAVAVVVVQALILMKLWRFHLGVAWLNLGI